MSITEVTETHTLDDKEVYARLYGEPLFAIPSDLYIPPQALEIILHSFEGPLDLLLYLIRKQNFDVLDIPMAQVTAQYLVYVDQLRQSNLELAGEYLLMAALLIEIKSRMLLPVKKADTGEEVEDPRAELVRRLLAYEQMKQAAQELDQLPRLERDFWVAHAQADLHIEQILPDVCAEDLRQAWQSILKRAKLHQSHLVTREQLSVRDHMSQILRRLSETEFLEFNQLFTNLLEQTESDAVAVVVVHFLAMLELVKEALIELSQSHPYAPIYLRLAYAPISSAV
ncbi:segregation and condensation protein A [Paenalcaligenes faecalis]|uniref:segregation and condensation protein A n=1 Tax=Paenalcaligenes faecalis TaxID=2980099 RepID=UPI0022B97C4D|nr:ScpA family protein [Paenalcaligenes faecalis]